MLHIQCPEEGGVVGASNHTNLRVHFAHFHMRETIVILEEGKQLYYRCPKCEIFVSNKALNGWHLTTEFCRQGEKKKRRRLEEE